MNWSTRSGGTERSFLQHIPTMIGQITNDVPLDFEI